jgi:hypothetical protein
MPLCLCDTHTHTMGMTCCRMLIQRYMDARRPTKPRLLGRMLGDVTQYKARRVGGLQWSCDWSRAFLSAQSILSLSLTEFYIYFSAFFSPFSRRDMAGGRTSKGTPMYMYAVPICVDPTERAASRLDRVETYRFQSV